MISNVPICLAGPANSSSSFRSSILNSMSYPMLDINTVEIPEEETEFPVGFFGMNLVLILKTS